MNILINIIITFLIYTIVPALIRVIRNRPLSYKTTKIIAFLNSSIIYLFFIIISTEGQMPNVALTFVYFFVNSWILNYGSSEEVKEKEQKKLKAFRLTK